MKRDSLSLFLSSEMLEWLMIPTGKTCRLSCGKRVAAVAICEVEMENSPEDGTVLLGDELSRNLGIPLETRLNIVRDGEMLRVGPLVGILAPGYLAKPGSFGAQDSFFRGLIAGIANLHGFAYVFLPEEVNWKRRTIKGYYLSPGGSGQWRQRIFPFPDVCYNRYFNVNKIRQAYALPGRLAKYGVKTFNSVLGNKWSVYTRLLKIKHIAAHLPETRLLESSQNLSAMLAVFKEVYIKPHNGCKGKGIIRVTKKKTGYIVKSADHSKTHIYKTPCEAHHFIQSSGSSAYNAIVQQGIRLSGKSPHFDIRVLAQKNRFNQWGVTGIAARIGAPGCITTNLHTGGKAGEVHTALKVRGFSPAQIKAIIAELFELALIIAEALDSKNRYIGELGLDFIIDTRGKVWFLEANPKPGRRSFTLINKELRKLSVSRPMEYACYLAGF